MTDNKIIKALKEILEIMLTMGDLQKASTIGKALDLINRLQAEIEKLNKLCEEQNEEIKRQNNKTINNIFLLKDIALIKAEAVKEFAEKLKNGSNGWIEISADDIDTLVKEMVGDSK